MGFLGRGVGGFLLFGLVEVIVVVVVVFGIVWVFLELGLEVGVEVGLDGEVRFLGIFVFVIGW